jgi:thioredoxin reductase (NADPH)
MKDIYDVIIIGAGPAGMNAALYASRANMNTLMIEKECPGGKMMKTKVIDNYIGGSSTDAMKLASDMFAQSIKYGAKYKQGNVVSITNNIEKKEIVLANGEKISSKSLILAMGGKLSNDNFKYDNYLNKGARQNLLLFIFLSMF